jgi:hypothetical protein
MSIILLKNLIKEQDLAGQPQPSVSSPPTTPPAPPVPNDAADAPTAAAPTATPTDLNRDFQSFKNEIKKIDDQKNAIIKKYETSIKNKMANKEISVFASKSQYFQPASNYTINVSGVKIDSHYDKNAGGIIYDMILIDDDKKYFLKNLETKSPTPAEEPEEKTSEAPQEPPSAPEENPSPEAEPPSLATNAPGEPQSKESPPEAKSKPEMPPPRSVPNSPEGEEDEQDPRAVLRKKKTLSLKEMFDKINIKH